MDMLANALISFSIYLIAILCIWLIYRRRHDVLLNELKATRKKSIEEDLSLATTEQLMKEMQSRGPGFILITPVASNSQKEGGMTVHVKGLPPQEAISCMKFACHVMENSSPHSYDEDEE